MFENYPIATTPRYRTAEPNAPIPLYEGDAEVSINGEVSTKHAEIRFVWLPSPDIDIRITDCYVDVLSEQNDVAVTLKGQDAPLSMRWTRVEMSGGENARPPSIVGRLQHHPLDDDTDLRCVLFHIANASSFQGSNIRNEAGTYSAAARAELLVPPWRIVLDTLREGSDRDAAENLKRSGGYGITHVGLVEREDRAVFHSTDVEPLLESIGWMLSFCRGARTFPLLLVGRDETDAEVATSWRCGHVAPMQLLMSWFDDRSSDGLTILQRLHQCFTDKIWREPTNLALHWYLICNNARDTSIEGAIVLQQAASEVLAWTLLVEDRRVLSKDGAEKLPASDKLRLLLSHCGIPLRIPDSLKALGAVAKKCNWPDGASATTEIRNALVHANPKKRGRVLGQGTEVLCDAWCLGQWYLELILLWLFDYGGRYLNRLKRGGWKVEAIERVPWAHDQGNGHGEGHQA